MPMIIKQVLNNNVAIARTESDEEVIAMGKGIVFQKKKGDFLANHTPEKIFRLDNQEVGCHLQSLINDVPIPIITTCYELIYDVQSKFNFNFQDYIYITLTEHLHHAINIYKTDNKLHTTPIDIKEIHPRAFEASIYALTLIQRNLNISFPINEANHIALHFINAEQPKGTELKHIHLYGNLKFNEVIQCLNDIGIVRNKDNAYYYDRFLQHLKYFSEHFTDERKDVQQHIDLSLQQHLHTHYPKSFHYANELLNSISNMFNIVIQSHHLFYFQLHIERILSSQKEGESNYE